METMTFFIYAIGISISILYSFIGPLLSLLKNAFTIDAIGHSIIFGIATGFLITHSLNSSFMLVFGLASAFLMNIINDFIQKNSIIEVDASLGITFSTLFTIGIMIISLYEKNIHLDIDMILLGNIEYSIYQTISLFNFHIPSILVTLLIFIAILGILISLQYEQINLFLFDAQFALMKGIPYGIISYILIAIITTLIVVTFNAMGSLLLLGIAVAPFGFSWTTETSLGSFIKKSILKSVIMTIIGITLSLYYDTSIAATIVFCVTLGSLLSLLKNITKNK